MKGEVLVRGEPEPKDEPQNHVPLLSDLPEVQQVRIRRRADYGMAAAELGPMGPENPALARVIAEVSARLKDEEPPSNHSVYRWGKRYRESGYNTSVFMLDAIAYRRRKPRIDPRIHELLTTHLQALMSKFNHATTHGLTNLAMALSARDMGYTIFVTKEGVEEFVGEYVRVAEETLKLNPRVSRKK